MWSFTSKCCLVTYQSISIARILFLSIISTRLVTHDFCCLSFLPHLVSLLEKANRMRYLSSCSNSNIALYHIYKLTMFKVGIRLKYCFPSSDRAFIISYSIPSPNTENLIVFRNPITCLVKSISVGLHFQEVLPYISTPFFWIRSWNLCCITFAVPDVTSSVAAHHLGLITVSHGC